MAWYKPENRQYWIKCEATYRGSMLRHFHNHGYNFKLATLSELIDRNPSNIVYLQPWLRYKNDFKFRPSYPQPYRNQKDWNLVWLSFSTKFIARIK
jgi:hypothetical protein